VKEGLVKIYREYEDNTNLIYNILPRGTLIGLSNLYVGSTFQFSVAALTNSSICSIDKSFMEQLLRDNGAFAKSVVESVNNEIHQLQEKLVSLTHKPLKGRLADSLVFLSREVFESRQFSHKLSRKDLAEFSGMSMMSLVRTLQEFMREGYVEEVDGKLNLLDMDALKVF
jgi:CRP/FNR family transcriptional regulator